MTQSGITQKVAPAAVPIPSRTTAAPAGTSPMLETRINNGEVSAIVVRCMCEREHVIQIEYPDTPAAR